MTINAYLTFAGNCRAAFEFYHSVFGGDFLSMQTYGDGPAAMGVPAQAKDLIMRVTLPVGSGMLAGSDAIEQSSLKATIQQLRAVCRARQQGAGGRSVREAVRRPLRRPMAMQDQFWGAYFGTCTDRFGINWMIDCEPGQG